MQHQQHYQQQQQQQQQQHYMGSQSVVQGIPLNNMAQTALANKLTAINTFNKLNSLAQPQFNTFNDLYAANSMLHNVNLPPPILFPTSPASLFPTNPSVNPYAAAAAAANLSYHSTPNPQFPYQYKPVNSFPNLASVSTPSPQSFILNTANLLTPFATVSPVGLAHGVNPQALLEAAAKRIRLDNNGSYMDTNHKNIITSASTSNTTASSVISTNSPTSSIVANQAADAFGSNINNHNNNNYNFPAYSNMVSLHQPNSATLKISQASAFSVPLPSRSSSAPFDISSQQLVNEEDNDDEPLLENMLIPAENRRVRKLTILKAHPINQFDPTPLLIFRVLIPTSLRKGENDASVKFCTPINSMEQHLIATVRVLGSSINIQSLYIIALDLCQLINIRKSNTAKAIALYSEIEKCSLPVVTQAVSGAPSLRYFTALSIQGVGKLLESSRSQLAKPLLRWLTALLNSLVTSNPTRFKTRIYRMIGKKNAEGNIESLQMLEVPINTIPNYEQLFEDEISLTNAATPHHNQAIQQQLFNNINSHSSTSCNLTGNNSSTTSDKNIAPNNPSANINPSAS
jgi:hypothetical protein